MQDEYEGIKQVVESHQKKKIKLAFSNLLKVRYFLFKKRQKIFFENTSTLSFCRNSSPFFSKPESLFAALHCFDNAILY